MPRRRSLAPALLLLLGLYPHVAAASVDPSASSIELSLYDSHEEIIVRDAAGRVALREIHRADEEPAARADLGAAADPRCTNGAAYTYLFRNSQGVRTPRPWRTVEPIAFSTANVPAGAASYWRSAVTAAAREWQDTLNPCGTPDRIAWRHTTSPDSTLALSSTCSVNADGANTIGFTNMGGWGAHGLLLGRACMRTTDTYYFEGDIIMNNHADAVWCNGACATGWDLQSLAAHEFGHYIGLGHVCNDADLNNPCDTTAESSAVMYPWIDQNSVKNRTLSAGDIAGANSLYPAARAFTVAAVSIDGAPPDGVLLPGETYDVTVDLRNTGYESWNVGGDTTLVTDPAGRCSPNAAADWLSCTVPSALDLDASNEPPTTWPNSAQTVIRGETGRFTFRLSASPAGAGTTVIESFRAAAGTERMEGAPAVLDVTIGTLAASLVRADGPDIGLAGAPVVENTIVGPLRSSVIVELRNAGTASWPVGTDAMTLRPAACSAFAAEDWAACDDVGYLQENLSRQGAPWIAPGESARISFAMIRGGSASGTYEETFSLSGSTGRFGNQAVLRFTVV